MIQKGKIYRDKNTGFLYVITDYLEKGTKRERISIGGPLYEAINVADPKHIRYVAKRTVEEDWEIYDETDYR